MLGSPQTALPNQKAWAWREMIFHSILGDSPTRLLANLSRLDNAPEDPRGFPQRSFIYLIGAA